MNRNRKILSGLLAAAAVLPVMAAPAQAEYHADSDTGVGALDYIEDQHRAERENRLTDEQQQLLKDAAAMQQHLRQPLDPAKSAPMAFEGDDLTYDERDGSFIAKGKVNILQLDAHRFQGELVTGNVKKQDVQIPDKAHILQMTAGQPRIILDGYKTNYNYGKKTGSMENAKGKVDAQYITAKRFEFYPDHIVAYNGTQTKCGAIKPDYHLSAEKITIYPNQKTVLEHMKFWIKGKVLFTRDRYEVDTRPGVDHSTNYPRIGYTNSDKMYMSWRLKSPVRKKVEAHENLLVTGAEGWRSNYDVTWNNAHMQTKVTYGHFEDGDDKWIKKEPSLIWNYGDHIGRSHVTYSLNSEYGRWYNDGIHSNHGYYGFGIGYDPIKFHRYTLYLGTGYGITRESYNDSRVAGMTLDMVLVKDINERWAAYTGYHYSKRNTANSLFDYGTDDYSKKLESGFSYRVDDRNRLVLGTRYDLDNNRWRNIDYYWYHDMHCAQLVLRYKSRQNTWGIRWQFTPW